VSLSYSKNRRAQHRINNPYWLIVITISLSACNDDNNSNPNSNEPTVLEGTWRKPCGSMDSHYDVITQTFTGNRFESDIRNYTDSNCLNPLSGAPNPTASGTLNIGNVINTTGGLKANELDTHIDTSNGAPFDEDDYTIFYIDTNMLYLGDDTGILDGSSPALRPDTLDASRIYERQ